MNKRTLYQKTIGMAFGAAIAMGASSLTGCATLESIANSPAEPKLKKSGLVMMPNDLSFGTYAKLGVSDIYLNLAGVDSETGKINAGDIATFVNSAKGSGHKFNIFPYIDQHVSDSDANQKLLEPAYRKQFLSDATEIIKTYNLPGWHFSVGSIPEGKRDVYVEYLKEARAQFPKGTIISASLPNMGSGLWELNKDEMENVLQNLDMGTVHTSYIQQDSAEGYGNYIYGQLDSLTQLNLGKCKLKMEVPTHANDVDAESWQEFETSDAGLKQYGRFIKANPDKAKLFDTAPYVFALWSFEPQEYKSIVGAYQSINPELVLQPIVKK